MSIEFPNTDAKIDEVNGSQDNAVNWMWKHYVGIRDFVRSDRNPFKPAALKDTGVSEGNVPLLNSSGKLRNRLLPEQVEEFTALSDTPSTFSGQADNVLAVKGDETGVEIIGNSRVVFENTAGWEFISSGPTHNANVAWRKIDLPQAANYTYLTFWFRGDYYDLNHYRDVAFYSSNIRFYYIYETATVRRDLIPTYTGPSTTEKFRIGQGDMYAARVGSEYHFNSTQYPADGRTSGDIGVTGTGRIYMILGSD